jgi:2-oxoglutarate dehydrogenase complex dehydrogenase (E1) component-like enzyme
VGFTAEAAVGRSSLYATDVAKSVGAPVLHVNGEDVPAVLRAAALAVEYRAAFRRDVFVDLVGYRRQ